MRILEFLFSLSLTGKGEKLSFEGSRFIVLDNYIFLQEAIRDLTRKSEGTHATFGV